MSERKRNGEKIEKVLDARYNGRQFQNGINCCRKFMIVRSIFFRMTWVPYPEHTMTGQNALLDTPVFVRAGAMAGSAVELLPLLPDGRVGGAE